MDRRIVLEEAMKIVSGEREEQYGTPHKNFDVIAKLWTTYLNTCVGLKGIDIDLSGEHVAAMMILLKVARTTAGSGKDDNWVDIAGYAALGAELADLEGCSNFLKSATITTPTFTVTAQPDDECFKHP